MQSMVSYIVPRMQAVLTCGSQNMTKIDDGGIYRDMDSFQNMLCSCVKCK